MRKRIVAAVMLLLLFAAQAVSVLAAPPSRSYTYNTEMLPVASPNPYTYNGEINGIDVGYTQGAGFNVYGPGMDRGTRVIDLFTDGHIETYDMRYKDIVGRKVDNPLKYIIMQLCPTNTFDAVTRIVKAFVTIAVILVIILLLTMFLK